MTVFRWFWMMILAAVFIFFLWTFDLRLFLLPWSFGSEIYTGLNYLCYYRAAQSLEYVFHVLYAKSRWFLGFYWLWFWLLYDFNWLLCHRRWFLCDNDLCWFWRLLLWRMLEYNRLWFGNLKLYLILWFLMFWWRLLLYGWTNFQFNLFFGLLRPLYWLSFNDLGLDVFNGFWWLLGWLSRFNFFRLCNNLRWWNDFFLRQFNRLWWREFWLFGCLLLPHSPQVLEIHLRYL